MTDKTIVSMAKASNNGTLQSSEQALKDALDAIGKQGAFKDGKKILILALDEGENKDQYSVSFIQAGMKMSQCVSLCEVAKTIFLSDMGYV
tara:strand:- start:27177 stop:27449 length:273 start_codon:yes stop_codon:yes gene_type:complete